ncbi:hypothetical protein AB0L25_25720 [Spirillospora sp. NPDC052242]
MDFHMDAHHMWSTVAEETTGLPHPEAAQLRMRPAAGPNARKRCTAGRGRNVQTVTEIWRFHCLCCLRVWEDVYEARHCGTAVAWRLSGVPAQPPWADPFCPECHSLRVKVLPAGLMVDHGAA